MLVWKFTVVLSLLLILLMVFYTLTVKRGDSKTNIELNIVGDFPKKRFKQHVPKFMLDLYHNTKNYNGPDVVRSVIPKSAGFIPSNKGEPYEKHHMLTFEVPRPSRNEIFLSAELKILSINFNKINEDLIRYVKITIFDNASGELLFLDELRLQSRNNTWLSFDLTKPLHVLLKKDDGRHIKIVISIRSKTMDDFKLSLMPDVEDLEHDYPILLLSYNTSDTTRLRNKREIKQEIKRNSKGEILLYSKRGNKLSFKQEIKHNSKQEIKFIPKPGIELNSKRENKQNSKQEILQHFKKKLTTQKNSSFRNIFNNAAKNSSFRNIINNAAKNFSFRNTFNNAANFNAPNSEINRDTAPNSFSRGIKELALNFNSGVNRDIEEERFNSNRENFFNGFTRKLNRRKEGKDFYSGISRGIEKSVPEDAKIGINRRNTERVFENFDAGINRGNEGRSLEEFNSEVNRGKGERAFEYSNYKINNMKNRENEESFGDFKSVVSRGNKRMFFEDYNLEISRENKGRVFDEINRENKERVFDEINRENKERVFEEINRENNGRVFEDLDPEIKRENGEDGSEDFNYEISRGNEEKVFEGLDSEIKREHEEKGSEEISRGNEERVFENLDSEIERENEENGYEDFGYQVSRGNEERIFEGLDSEIERENEENSFEDLNSGIIPGIKLKPFGDFNSEINRGNKLMNNEVDRIAKGEVYEDFHIEMDRENEEKDFHETDRDKRNAFEDDYEEDTNVIWDEDNQRRNLGRKWKRLRNTCRRKPLYVDFSEIDFDTWIVQPSGYEAFQCQGKCFYPVAEHLSPTKHAIVQAIVHNISPSRASRSCCVPTKLESISVLYIDSKGVLTYRYAYKDMVVSECGCR